MSKSKMLSGDKIKGGQAGGTEKRGGALEVKGFKNDVGNSFTFSTADSANEQALRGGSGTSQSEAPGKIAGGDLNPSGAKNGFPSNSGVKSDK